MPSVRQKAPLAAAMLLWAASGAAQTIDDPGRVLVPLVEQQLRARDIAGAVIAVVDAGVPTYTRALGVAEVATGRPLQTDTPLRIASISKVFTALAVMQLVDEGRLDLDRDVNQYLDFHIAPSSADRPATLRRLLSHQNGFEDTVFGIGSLDGARRPLGEYLPANLPRQLAPDPGSVTYSNYAYAVAAYVVERVARTSFEEHLDQRIFQPLGMTRTTARQPLPVPMLSLASAGYGRARVPPTRESMAAATIHEVGSTGVVSTAEDMGRFMSAFLDPSGRLLSARAVASMRAPQVRTPHGFVGLGVYTPLATGANVFVGHDGGSGGLHGSLGLLPDRGFGVFVFYNSRGSANAVSPEGELLEAISSRYLRDVTIDARRFAGGVAGTYESLRRIESNVFALATLLGQLRVEETGDGAIALHQAFLPFGGLMLTETSPGRFTRRGLDVSFANLPSGLHAQIGAAVAMYARVPWWRSARLIVPALLVGILFATVMTIRWAWHLARGRTRDWTGRLSILLSTSAIAGAVWLVSVGRLLAVTGSATLPIILLTIYIAAWSGAGLAGVSAWRLLRARDRGASWTDSWSDAAVSAVALTMAAFSIAWRVAGTWLPA